MQPTSRSCFLRAKVEVILRACVGRQVAGAGAEFLHLAFDGGIADVLILKDAVGIDGERVGNGLHAEELRH